MRGFLVQDLHGLLYLSTSNHTHVVVHALCARRSMCKTLMIISVSIIHVQPCKTYLHALPGESCLKFIDSNLSIIDMNWARI